MDFLESLYSIENFGIYLFVVIGILVVLFLVILFFGKKDEQKRKEEAQTSNETVDTFKETTNVTPVEVPVVEQNPFGSMQVPEVNQVSKIEENTSVEPISEEKIPEVVEKEFDFDALAAAISKELESIDNVPVNEAKEVKPDLIEPATSVEPVLPKKEEKEFPVLEESQVVKEEPKVSFEIPEEKNTVNIEEKKVMPRPTVFSSVYVNRNIEEPKIMEEQNPNVEEAKVEPTPIVEPKASPVAPKIELPKMMDLPKKK